LHGGGNKEERSASFPSPRFRWSTRLETVVGVGRGVSPEYGDDGEDDCTNNDCDSAGDGCDDDRRYFFRTWRCRDI